MITDDDLFAFCKLSPEEIAAIAEHDHENLILSIAHGETLLKDKKGIVTIKHYLEENIAMAASKGDRRHEEALRKVYKAFEKAHPTAEIK